MDLFNKNREPIGTIDDPEMPNPVVWYRECNAGVFPCMSDGSYDKFEPHDSQHALYTHLLVTYGIEAEVLLWTESQLWAYGVWKSEDAINEPYWIIKDEKFTPSCIRRQGWFYEIREAIQKLLTAKYEESESNTAKMLIAKWGVPVFGVRKPTVGEHWCGRAKFCAYYKNKIIVGSNASTAEESVNLVLEMLRPDPSRPTLGNLETYD